MLVIVGEEWREEVRDIPSRNAGEFDIVVAGCLVPRKLDIIYWHGTHSTDCVREETKFGR